MIFNTQQSYGSVSKILHWVVAFLILALLGVGFFMTGMDFSPVKLQIYTAHKSFGMIVLMLASVRILWRLATIRPEELETHRPWERKLAHVIHVLLYFGMFAMPLSGWAMSGAGDFPNSFFGFFTFPDIVAKDEATFKILRGVHTYAALALIAGIGLHIAGAFKHHFIDRDITLQRMSVRHLGFIRAGLLAVVAGAALALPVYLYAQKFIMPKQDVALAEIVETAPAQNAGWVIDAAVSAIKFEATQYGTAFSGNFPTFGGRIIFDPDNLAAADVEIKIDVASIKTGSADRDAQALGADWFNTAEFPQAVFRSVKFIKTGANRYDAHGELTVRGVTLPLILPFSLEITESENGGKRAVMTAQTGLNRLAFGVGQGQWADEKAIGDRVGLDIRVEATLP